MVTRSSNSKSPETDRLDALGDLPALSGLCPRLGPGGRTEALTAC